MNAFYEHHKDSIRWHYRCFDRILLNGLIQPFQQPERVVGFFNTYRQLYPVSRHTLRGIADQFQSWLKGWSEKRNIPIVEAPKGRRDEFVEPYFKRATPDAVVVILKAREPARIMKHLLEMWPMARLSVNLNKVALLRNSRRTGVPDLLESLTERFVVQKSQVLKHERKSIYSPTRGIVGDNGVQNASG